MPRDSKVCAAVFALPSMYDYDFMPPVMNYNNELQILLQSTANSSDVFPETC